MNITEAHIEQIAIDLLKAQGYQYLDGGALINNNERTSADMILANRLQAAINLHNPDLPPSAKEEAFRKVLRNETPDLFAQNEQFHQYLTEGIDVSFRTEEGMKSDKVWLVDYRFPIKNEWLVVNQLDVVEGHFRRRPDLVLFLNGLPIVVIELKNATNEKADTKAAFNQIETYKKEIPSLFAPNAFSVISDYWFAKAGTISSAWSRFMEWKSKDGDWTVEVDKNKQDINKAELPFLIEGMLAPARLLDLLRHFIVFEKTRTKTIKKLAAYHQYFAVNKAIERTITASRPDGDKRAGVVWHTQGSGKSLSMVFYTGKLVLNGSMNNPTIVVLTDRNDLDQQLFETFSGSQGLIRQTPTQAENRAHLRKLLSVASGGVVFTTIQKFFPEEKGDTYPMLTERNNVVVVADEAHRSQYDFIDGFARHMRDALPNASFIGFTGTPIEKEDANTQAVFGDYVHVYDIQQAVEDGATVRIYYESRLAQIKFKEDMLQVMDEEIEYITEQQEVTERNKNHAKWTQKEAIIGNEKRLQKVAEDLVVHYEKRAEVMDGKAMIVAMSRRIAIALHDAIIKIRPDWYSPHDSEGAIKVIMTGSASDPLPLQEHIRNKPRRKAIGDRLKDPSNPLKMVIVRDMWLTGFDAPCLHTLYVDKPMSGHNLMQAIARVNRVFKDKQGGLIVDYIGIANDLKKALAVYTDSGGKGKPTFDKQDAVNQMLKFHEIVVNIFDNNFKYQRYFKLTIPKERLDFMLDATEHILQLPNGTNRFTQFVTKLSQAFGLANPHEEASRIRDEVALFQAIQARLLKLTRKERKESDEDIESAIRKIVSKALISENVVDVFDAAGLEKPEISILSDDFLQEIKNMKRENSALELLKRLLNDELKVRAKTNIVQSKKFSDRLKEAIIKYQNNLLSTAEIIEKMMLMAKEMREADKRGEILNLAPEELAFFDALSENESAKEVLGDEVLKDLALVLAEKIRKNTTIDWTKKESIRAKLRVIVKRTLRKYGYPPKFQKNVVEQILKQSELMADNVL